MGRGPTPWPHRTCPAPRVPALIAHPTLVVRRLSTALWFSPSGFRLHGLSVVACRFVWMKEQPPSDAGFGAAGPVSGGAAPGSVRDGVPGAARDAVPGAAFGFAAAPPGAALAPGAVSSGQPDV